MSYINNINKDGDDINFQIVNTKGNKTDMKISFVNALRRIILSDIPIIATSRLNTQFTDNTSMLDDQYLAHRLNMSTVINTTATENHMDEISISLNRLNEGDDIETVYLRDMTLTRGKEKIDIDKFFKHPDTIFAKLKYDQKINMTSKLMRSTCRNDGAGFCPVGTCYYNFDYDNTDPNDEDRERKYFRTDNGLPAKYNFFIEPSGQLSAKETMLRGIDVLIDKLNTVKQDLVDKSGLKIVPHKAPTKMKAIDYHITDENETIGNLVDEYIGDIDKTYYSGYHIPHPLKNVIIVRIGYEDGDLDKTSELLVKTIDFLIDFASQFKKEWQSKA